LALGVSQAFALDNNTLVTLSKKIIEANNNDQLRVSFEELKELYYKENKYSEYADFLKSLKQQKESLSAFTNYYTALTRYNQLKYLEKIQNWDEYFAQGNNYRDQITQSGQKAIQLTTPKDPLNIYSRLILFQFHKDQEDNFTESSLSDLSGACLEYSKDAKDLKPLKDVADKLWEYGEKRKSKELYQIYVNKLIGLVKEDKELADIAAEFYKNGNLELAETVYDVYVERISKALPKEKLIPVLFDIARSFSYKDEGQKDPYYAEKIFKKIEEIGTKNAFDEESAYMRAFNALRMKDLPKAKDLYLGLATQYPQTKYADEAYYKAGIISAYVLRDIKAAREYFEKLAGEPGLSPQVISGLYNLGLLSQWENDLTKAKDYYNKLLEKAGNDFTETVSMAKERLKEIIETKPLEYNLKTFLDISLKAENPPYEATKVDLSLSHYKVKKGEAIDLKCTPYSVQSGCMQVEVQYLWSGDLGNVKPPLEKPQLNTAYAQGGTKEINLVVVSPSGVLDRSIEIVDVD
jgi:hypothetical protein